MADLEAQDKEVTEKSQLKEEEADTANECYTKEELLELSDTPGWNNTRRILLVLFWLAWFGMIVWSVMIVVYAPKCKKEPDQAWFTKGAVAKFDCGDLTLDEITAQVGPIEAGQYQGIMADGCLPSLADITSNSNQTANVAKVAELTKLAAGKDIKMLFSIDAQNVGELSGENVISDLFPADGYLLRNAANLRILFNVSDTDRSFFIDGTSDIPDGAFYFKELGNDPINEARQWIEGNMNVSVSAENVNIGVVQIHDGPETLWDAKQDLENAPSNKFVMSAVLPGGFLVPFEPVKEDKDQKFVSFGKDWRRGYESLRAISGSVMRWFADGTGFSRKFDLQAGIEIVANFGAEDFVLDSVRGRIEPAEDAEISRGKIYPTTEGEIVNLTPGDAAVFVVT